MGGAPAYDEVESEAAFLLVEELVSFFGVVQMLEELSLIVHQFGRALT